MKNIFIFALVASVVWSLDLYAKTDQNQKQTLTGQKYNANEPRPAVYKSNSKNKFKVRSVSSSKVKSKELKY